jgi:cytochrome P450
VGEHARNGVAGWSELAFDSWYLKRNVLGTVVHLPRRPDMVEHVLLTNAANYVRPRMVRRIFAPFIGEGLFNSNAELWRTQRKLVAASFAPGAVAQLTSLMAEGAARQIAGWPQRGTIDIAQVATETTLRIIADALFSSDPRITTPEAMAHIEAALVAVGRIRVAALLGFPNLRIGRVAKRGERGREYLRATLEAIVAERGPDGGPGFLGGLIRDLHDRFSPEQARRLAVDNAATFYVAGHETTATALAWSIYLLSNTPEIQDRARAEAQAALAGGGLATVAERLPYLRQVLDEAMRLYPPAPRIEREAAGDDEFCGIGVREGEHVSIWPWVIHRHRQLWDNPDAFDPDRFAPGSEASRHRFQYIPFGGGPRVCVGARFATIEALVVLAHWLSARRFAPLPGFTPNPVATVTLRPQGGLPVEVMPV